MERLEFERTQGYLAHLLGYLEGLSGAWAAASGRGAQAALPERIARILADSGYLEGLHLKSLGLLSQELQEFIIGVGFAFEVEVSMPGPFKLPFLDQDAALQRKTLNPFREEAWLVYHGSLLSAYAMRPLRFERASVSQDGLEEVLRVREAPAPAEGASSPLPDLAPDSLHALNNALAGITSYVSLILGERKNDADLQGKLGLVLEAATKAAAAQKAAAAGLKPS